MKEQSKKMFQLKKSLIVLMLLSALLVQNLNFPFLPSEMGAVHAAGSGTAADPFQISTIQDLKDISNGLDKHYILTKDIVFPSGTYWAPIGNWNKPFTGTLNGNGFKIKNLLIDSYSSYIGLFSATSSATIKYLTLENVNIVGEAYAGAIAGRALQRTKIENCAVSGSVSGNGWTGGLTGELMGGGYILQSSNAAKVNSSNFYTGGITGVLDGSVIRESFNTGNVKGQRDVGGIAGYCFSNSLIENTYNRGMVAGGTHTGGILGNADTSRVKFCYSTGEVEGDQYSGGIAGYATGAIQYSAAMCNEIKANSKAIGRKAIGRIVGSKPNSLTLNDNVAFEDMKVTIAGEGTTIEVSGHSLIDGYGIDKARMMQGSYLETLSWDFNNIWKKEAGGQDYPVLKNATAIPPVQEIKVVDISLDKTEVIKNVDDRFSLIVTIVPVNATNKNVIWASSDPSVAVVDTKGNVTAKAEGHAVITATSVDVNKKASCYITVNKVITSIPVSEVKLDRTAEILEIEQTLSLTATVLPNNATNKRVLWESSNPAVAGVDQNGIVTAIAEGFAAIAAFSEADNKVAFCNLMVRAAPPAKIPVGSITLHEESLSLELGEEAQISAQILPVNATNQEIIWTSSDDAIATVDEKGLVKAVSSGEVKITATAVDGGLSAVCNLLVKPLVIKENIALSATATSNSESSSTYKAGKSIDGNPDTRWLAKSGIDNVYLELDFGELKSFNQVKIAEFDQRISSYAIQIFEGNDWIDVFAGNGINTNEVIEFDEVEASKVRIMVYTRRVSYGASIYEFEVY